MVLFAAEEAVVHFVYLLKSKGFFAVKQRYSWLAVTVRRITEQMSCGNIPVEFGTETCSCRIAVVNLK